MFDLNERISTLRKKRNLTQSKLAELLAISPQAISSWERGSTMPDITKLSELADILGVSVDRLLGNTDRSNLTKEEINMDKLFDESKMYTYLKAFANSRSMLETQKALVCAREKHKNQSRKELHILFIL